MKTRPAPAKTGTAKKTAKELKTEPPISEKDEVKKAEDRTRKAVKRTL